MKGIDVMDIKVLGPGCNNCVRLEANAREALTRLGRDASIEKITDYVQIAGYGVMSTPALVVDGSVIVSGRVPSADEVARLLDAS
jgi:small redox-active disulfide protein 2